VWTLQFIPLYIAAALASGFIKTSIFRPLERRLVSSCINAFFLSQFSWGFSLTRIQAGLWLEVHSSQQVGEARVRAQRIEHWICINVIYRAVIEPLFQPLESFVLLAKT
jgi:hypothetical protein